MRFTSVYGSLASSSGCDWSVPEPLSLVRLSVQNRIRIRRVFAHRFAIAIPRRVDDPVLHELHEALRIREHDRAAGARIESFDSDGLAGLRRVHYDELHVVGIAKGTAEIADQVIRAHELYVNTVCVPNDLVE